MGHPNQVQYPVPRCPRCRKYRNAGDVRLRNLGFDLREIARKSNKVQVQCQFCHHIWWSTNDRARAGVLTQASTVTAAPVEFAATKLIEAQPQVNPDR